ITELEVYQKADPDPLNWLDRKLQADFKAGSELMRVSIEGDNGDELVKLLGAVARVYLEDAKERESGQRRERRDQLVKESEEHRKKLDSHREQINKIAVALGSTD